MSRVVALAALGLAATAAWPRAAEAQGRGTLQVYAQVVDTRAANEGLQATKAELQGHRAVSTLAHVTVAQVAGRPSSIVVTIDYSRN
jgi:hypothetical protein